MDLKSSVLELIRRAATDLPEDVVKVLSKAYGREDNGTPAKGVFKTILENIEMAKGQSTPICQDTGSLLFFIDLPGGDSEKKYRKAINEAVIEATEKQYLRPNAVDPVTSKNSGNNIGENAPYIHFSQWDKDEVRIRVMLKGGGSENVGTQYKLPFPPLKAGRDLNGVRKVIIDAVVKAQGLGCAPGTLGIGIGGDRVTSYALSKVQFFRKIGERNSDPKIAEFESELLDKINKLLDVFVSSQARHPATFFVAISYMCWAFRRKTMVLKKEEVTYD